VFDIEKSLITYLKVLRLVEACKASSSQILFVGCPPQMELVVKKKLNSSRHIFINESSWVLGSLTNSSQSDILPNLIVTFNTTRTFPSKECFKKGVPLISFIDDACDFSFIDYPIFINLKSEGASNMYYNLINQSI
jgi:ribosomal protein S2